MRCCPHPAYARVFIRVGAWVRVYLPIEVSEKPLINHRGTFYWGHVSPEDLKLTYRRPAILQILKLRSKF